MKNLVNAALFIGLSSVLAACGGGSGSDAGSAPNPGPGPEPVPTPVVPPTVQEAGRFLTQASFGPNNDSIEQVVANGLEGWFTQQLAETPSLHLEGVLAQFPEDQRFLDDQGNPLPEIVLTASNSFWQTAIESDDQLRQRMAFALSQILVISNQSDLFRVPQTVAAYMDILTVGAFGNYRDLLQEVTYSPAMAIYLTYLRNEKADPITGRVPDENYARELLQLFTLGLVELNPDGTAVTDNSGQPIELFDNQDITGLAKVFTGLSAAGVAFNAPLLALPESAYYEQLAMFDAFHSLEAKQFLGTTIAAGTTGDASISLALDTIFEHPNVGPFLARQLIQRFVTSAPLPEYVARVAGAFDAGNFTLPSGAEVGDGRRGDLAATLAAILFDEEARSADSLDNPQFGKLREPVIRFTHWARAFNVNSADASNELLLQDTSSSALLGQHPYRSPSVFNFYRPGYIAPGTETGALNLTAPELQISNATTIVGYPNVLTAYALGSTPKRDQALPATYVADYSIETGLADDPEALLDHLDSLLTYGQLEADTRARITQAIEIIPPGDEETRLARARLASLMVMTAPEYLVQR